MHNLFNWKFTGGAAVVIVAFCVGIFEGATVVK